MWHGRWKEAEEQLLLGNDEIREFRPAMIVEGLVRLGELRWRQGRWEEASELFEQVKQADLSQLGRAELALSLDHLDEARDLVEKYLRRIPTHDRIERAFGLEIGVRAAIAASRLEQAKEYAEELATIAAKVRTDPMLGGSCLAQGLLAAASGAHDQARACLEDATDYYARHGAPFEEARARLELARSLAALGRAEQASRTGGQPPPPDRSACPAPTSTERRRRSFAARVGSAGLACKGPEQPGNRNEPRSQRTNC
jgi:tetratricopeptide (TPR) repeat protein